MPEVIPVEMPEVIPVINQPEIIPIDAPNVVAPPPQVADVNMQEVVDMPVDDGVFSPDVVSSSQSGVPDVVKRPDDSSLPPDVLNNGKNFI